MRPKVPKRKPLDIHMIASRAKSLARRMGLKEHADDLSQAVVEHYLSGLGQHQDIRHAMIDVVRKKFKRKNMHRHLVPIDSIELSAVVEKSNADFVTISSWLSGHSRIVFWLMYYWGFTQIEVAECFGLTESRISLIKSELIKTIKKRQGNETE